MPPGAAVVVNLGKNEMANGKAAGSVTALTAIRSKYDGYYTDLDWYGGVWDKDIHAPEDYNPPAVVVNITPA